MTISKLLLPDGRSSSSRSLRQPSSRCDVPPLLPPPLEGLRSMGQTLLQQTVKDECARVLGAVPIGRSAARAGLPGSRACTRVHPCARSSPASAS